MKDELQFKKCVPYEVDFRYLNEKVDFSLTVPNREPQKKSFWNLIQFFEDKAFIEPTRARSSDWISVECENAEYRIQCTNLIARHVLAILLNLQNDNKSIENYWYLYEIDDCFDVPMSRNSFFLAHDYKILLEDVGIATCCWEECDPNILVDRDLDSSTSWNAYQVALTKWYYQKFYQDTLKGQVLLIKENPSISFPFHKNARCFSKINSSLSSIDKKLKWLIIGAVLIVVKFIFLIRLS